MRILPCPGARAQVSSPGVWAGLSDSLRKRREWKRNSHSNSAGQVAPSLGDDGWHRPMTRDVGVTSQGDVMGRALDLHELVPQTAVQSNHKRASDGPRRGSMPQDT